MVFNLSRSSFNLSQLELQLFVAVEILCELAGEHLSMAICAGAAHSHNRQKCQMFNMQGHLKQSIHFCDRHTREYWIYGSIDAVIIKCEINCEKSLSKLSTFADAIHTSHVIKHRFSFDQILLLFFFLLFLSNYKFQNGKCHDLSTPSKLKLVEIGKS